MTLSALISSITIKATEYGIRFDAAMLPRRYDEILSSLRRWSSETRMWFCDSSQLTFNSGGLDGPFSIEDSARWSYDGVPVKLVKLNELFASDGSRMPEMAMLDIGRVQPGTRHFYRPGRGNVQFLWHPNSRGAETIALGASGYRFHAEFDYAAGGFNPANVTIDIGLAYEQDFRDFCIMEMLSAAPVAEQGERFAELWNWFMGPQGRIAQIRAEHNDAPTLKGRKIGEKITRVGRHR